MTTIYAYSEAYTFPGRFCSPPLGDKTLRRIHFFEILDQAWCPKAVREGATDALEAITSSADIYRSVREPMMSAIRISGATRVVDLCSGGGGPWLSKGWLSKLWSSEPCVALTDKFPSPALAARVARNEGMYSVDSPVDATDVPEELCGFRTIFSSFHHFPDSMASKILGDAVRRGDGFASAEVTSRSGRAMATIFLLPLYVWLLTPRMRPFRWSRLLLTYLIPVIPFVILWDGLVSCLRTRTPEELLALTRPFPEYEWTAGYAGGQDVWLAPVYLIGLPRGTCHPGGFATRADAASPPFVVARRPNFRGIERKT
jgi:hypothetical protein